jgi:hypothetical protein
MKQKQFYCVSCRAKRTIRNDEDICFSYNKIGQAQLVAYCPKCDQDLYKYVKMKDGPKLKKKFGKC